MLKESISKHQMINVRKKTPTGTTGLLVLPYGKFSDSVSVGGTRAGWERISGESLLLLLMLLSEQQVRKDFSSGYHLKFFTQCTF